ncbi:MAG: hypothetical protein RM049_26705 [Nostoc sp. DedQUE04]|uniref:hypothetical protein n=1 Tax=Nostoc sp. DedQUE04 TaxID=3075390 RepID=UPI002AD26AB3|nr:hypothetical protein [Nostoc sp. DedQUE04]MDZ8138851.1 hypothetical protein [Nostoc sp. DedQUE04]
MIAYSIGSLRPDRKQVRVYAICGNKWKRMLKGESIASQLSLFNLLGKKRLVKYERI